MSNPTRRLVEFNDNGVPLVAGGNTYSPVIVYGKEMLPYGNYFTSSTLSVANTTVIPVTTNSIFNEVISNNIELMESGKWVVWYTAAGGYFPATASPTSLDNKINISYTNSGYSGLCQKFNGLIVGANYSLVINFHKGTQVATLEISTYFNSLTGTPPTIVALSGGSKGVFELPSSFSSTGEIIFNFTAKSPNEILFLNFFSSNAAAGSVTEISSISLREKQEYQIPVVANEEAIGFTNVIRDRGSEFADDKEPSDEVIRT